MKIVVLGALGESLVNFRGPLLRDLVANNHTVLTCATDAPEDTRNKLGKLGVAYQNINIERVGMNPRRDFNTIYELVKIFRRFKPDVFLGYTIKPVIYGSIAARISGVSNIYTMIEGLGYAFMNDSLKSKVVGKLASVLYRMALQFNNKVFFLNPDNLNTFKEKRLISSSQAVMINGIGVDLKHFSLADYPETTTFLMIGRLLVDKGIREYVAAAKLVKEQFPQVRFLLVGWIDKENPAGVEEWELESWIASGVIEYMGKLSDVRPAIAQSSVYVLPSYHEGLPVTVMEAMAMGRPIITTDAPGCRETVTPEKNGVLVPVRDVNALVNAMVEFIRKPYMVHSMGASSRNIAEEKYDVQKINRVMLETMGLNHP